MRENTYSSRRVRLAKAIPCLHGDPTVSGVPRARMHRPEKEGVHREIRGKRQLSEKAIPGGEGYVFVIYAGKNQEFFYSFRGHGSAIVAKPCLAFFRATGRDFFIRTLYPDRWSCRPAGPSVQHRDPKVQMFIWFFMIESFARQ
jgi:hypothetical protein